MTPRIEQEFEPSDYSNEGVSMKPPVEFPIYDAGHQDSESELSFLQRLGRAESNWLNSGSIPQKSFLQRMAEAESNWLQYGSGVYRDF